jgi:ABC-type multidrug transport system ATPase subunit
MIDVRKTGSSRVLLQDVGKKFGDRWVLKNISLDITSGQRLAVEGPNGSGKSTLLQVIAGYITPSKGTVDYFSGEQKTDPESVFFHLSVAAPYLDVIDDFTLEENARFFVSHKPLLNGLDTQSILSVPGLQHSNQKAVRHFSSGMKQRLKLALAIFADTDLLLLDEPLSNLDEDGYEWYKSVTEKYLGNRIVIVCTNQVKEEAFFCNRKFSVIPTAGN